MKTTNAGFTMVEALIALSVLGVMMSVGAPPLRTFLENSQLNSDTNDLFTSLFVARSEAVTRNTTVSLCKIDPNTPDTCDNSENWQSGWISFVDPDSDGIRDPGELILETYTGMTINSIVASTNFANVISYRPSGFGSTSGIINICINGVVAQDIFINATGRPRVADSSCA